MCCSLNKHTGATDWWTPSVRENFGEKTRCLSEEYSGETIMHW